MAMPETYLEKWAQLNQDNQQQIGHFIDFLLAQQHREALPGKARQPLNYGVFRGKIKVPDGFDDPMPEFKEYM